MGGYVIIVRMEHSSGGEPPRQAFAIAEASRHRALALFKLRPEHTADEHIEAVAQLRQAVLNALGLKPGQIVPL
jgi:hypothetical protein